MLQDFKFKLLENTVVQQFTLVVNGHNCYPDGGMGLCKRVDNIDQSADDFPQIAIVGDDFIIEIVGVQIPKSKIAQVVPDDAEPYNFDNGAFWPNALKPKFGFVFAKGEFVAFTFLHSIWLKTLAKNSYFDGILSTMRDCEVKNGRFISLDIYARLKGE